MSYLSPLEIQQYAVTPATANDPARPLREGLQNAGQYDSAQLAGCNFPIACVALEITQRCNLDCSLCYLSDLAETVQDVPLFELNRRIAQIHQHYGAHTNIQITGGDPTLRSIPDLVAIVQTIKSYSMRCALFTNGIKASREMLVALSQAGLDDIAFHVDMTQERKGYADEVALNTIRQEYIARAQDLPLRIMFNTTIYADNVQEVPALVQFFVDNADKITIASFQMQADTGRGVLRGRDQEMLAQQKVIALIRTGAKSDLSFDFPKIGHSDCNKYTSMLISGSAQTSVFDRSAFFQRLFATIAEGVANHWSPDARVIPFALRACWHSPQLIPFGLAYLWRKFWALKSGILRGKPVHRLGFFIHNFMDESKLEPERCAACVFMVATAEGPMSMCVHNAKRDAMITQPVPQTSQQQAWDPLAGQRIQAQELPLKKLKGRLRLQKNTQKSGKTTPINLEQYR